MIQLLKLTASKLHNRKLKGLTGEELSGLLGEVQARFHLDNVDEAVVFTALFDCGCGGRKNDLNDLVAYFGCTLLQMMEYVVAIRSLVRKHLVVQTNRSEFRVVEQMFIIPDYVIESILENKMPHLKEYMPGNVFNQYDFCEAVDTVLQNRNSSDVDSLKCIEFLERENAGMSLVKELKGVVPQLDERAIFYKLCFGFTENSSSDVDDILEDIYKNYGARLQAKHALLSREHPLVVAGLMELVDKEYLELTTAGERLFLGEDFERLKTKVESDCYGFAKMVEEYVDRSRRGTKTARDTYRMEAKLVAMEKDNHHISCLAKVQNLIEEPGYRILFYLACEGCIDGSGVELPMVLNLIYSPKDCSANLSLFKSGSHKLQRLDLIEMVTESSFFGKRTKLILTDRGKELYFGEDARFFVEKIDDKELIRASGIREKRLFFSPEEQEQLSLVGNVLNEENYRALVDRLEAKSLPRGIAVLLYGEPGTGKTESVMQWARQSGRDIVHVDISASKSMWYGESEKIVKQIFTRYRSICKHSAQKPILLFNEADALFSTRQNLTGRGSIDQTENAIQNIILEEMETLDGILIATTNLVDNLDKAFERRFLFKIRFNKPSVEAKRNIWLDKLPVLTDEQATRLAATYNFSGGEIDNIVRKVTLTEVVDGTAPSWENLIRICNEEKIGRGGSSGKIGFNR